MASDIPRFLLARMVFGYAVYRITTGEADEIFEGEVHYKILEFGLTNRAVFESLFGNRILRMDGLPFLYLPASQSARLWQEGWLEMQEKKYTLRAQVRTKKLLLGGFGVAEIISIDRLEKEPMISK